MKNITWGHWGTHIAKLSLIGGMMYTAGLMGSWAMGETYSSLPDWIFRLTYIIMIIWGVWSWRVYKRGNITLGQGLGTGMALTVGVTALMSISIWLFQTQIEPQYHQNAKAVYEHGQRNKMVVNFLKENDKTKLEPQDEALIQSGLQKHLDSVNFFFTTKGAIAITWIYALVWGFGVSLTIAFLSRPVDEEKQRKLDSAPKKTLSKK